MRRSDGSAGRTPKAAAMALGMAVLLSGCGGFDRATSGMADSVAGAGERIGAPWGGSRPGALATESLTVQRVRGVATAAEPLQPEAGDVWPVAEAPRATLMNPDQALRGAPDYRPEAPPPPPPRRRRGSAGPALEPSVSSTEFPSMPPPPTARMPEPPPVRADGQVIHTPSGPVVTSGGTDRIQPFNQPGGGTGVVVRDGNTVTITGPDGRVQVVPAPR